MSYHHFYKKLSEHALQAFPSLRDMDVSWEHLVSPLELRLPKIVLANAEEAIRTLYKISRRQEYRAQLEVVPGISDHPTQHHSVLMAYDFHTDEDGNCYLVEVNTNASGFMFSSLMEMTHKNLKVEEYAPLKDLRASFESELKLWRANASAANVAITDEDIEQQKMYPEFLMYRDFFAAMGWKAEFCEARDFVILEEKLCSPEKKAFDFVYNRLTDFYFEEHEALRDGFKNDRACISPNPYEYWLLGDKQRLVQLGQPEFLDRAGVRTEERDVLSKVIIPTFEKSHFPDADEIWSQRRKLFFKPKRSHGGKSVYRGESVSRKVFERLMTDDILIQNYQPAQRWPIDDPNSVMANWKFDLRFFVYEDRIQLACARIYQGQVTNFASPMGGFTQVSFI